MGADDHRQSAPRRGALQEKLSLLGQRRFGLYTLGNGISLIGSWMQRIALIYLIWEMTGSGFWLGVLATVDMLPVLVIGPFAGVVADRVDRLRLTRLCQYGLGALAALFGVLLVLDLLSLAVMISLAAANGCLIAIGQPARMALVQGLVARPQVGSAVALSSVNVNLARITGPAIAGVMLVHLPVYWVFFVNAALTWIFVVLLGFVHLDAVRRPSRSRSVLGDIVGGFGFVLRDPGIRLLLILLFFGGAGVRAVQDLFPVFAVRNFDLTATGIAVLTSGMAAGAVWAGLLSGSDTRLTRLVWQVARSWALAAAGLAGLVVSPGAWTDAAMAAFVGFFVTRGVIGTQTFVQLRTADAMRGRALSVHGLVSRGSPALGALGTGWAYDLVGLTLPVLLASGLVLVTVALSLPAIRALGEVTATDD